METPFNPYEPPATEFSPPHAPDLIRLPAPCRQCGSLEARRIASTWWGGTDMTRRLHHVECLLCHRRFNAKTGRSNRFAIALYTILPIALLVAIAVVLHLLP
jgi:hypothetical protein